MWGSFSVSPPFHFVISIGYCDGFGKVSFWEGYNTSPSHGENRGSSPLGSANHLISFFNDLYVQ